MIEIDPRYNWQTFCEQGVTVFFVGDRQPVTLLSEYLFSHAEQFDPDSLADFLASIKGNFALIAQGPEWILAITDTIRSYPVIYADLKDDGIRISNSASLLKNAAGLNELDALGALEFKMAGYVTGRSTLYKNLKQLQAGELLFYDSRKKDLCITRYYTYLLDTKRTQGADALIDELAAITDSIFAGIIEEASGRPIWVPLSGGLDSRLVLCKLKELGHRRLFAFSYGPPGNYEAKAAKVVAKKLDVPWIFVPSKQKESRDFFNLEKRKSYWQFADGLCSIPFMQDLDVLLQLMKQGRLTENAIIINGQSGDYITGGHIPMTMIEKGDDFSLEEMLTYIYERHFALWLQFMNNEHAEKIKNAARGLIEDVLQKKPQKAIYSYYEYWEWQERQCKYVVNGQRNYDFLGLEWKLPLWHKDYLDFWCNIPLELKANQKLYKDYLCSYNYRGLFADFNPTIWRWPGIMIGIVPIARLVKFLFGEPYKKKMYTYATYFGHYRNHFACYGFRYFLENIDNARNEISFSVKTWCEENNIPFE